MAEGGADEGKWRAEGGRLLAGEVGAVKTPEGAVYSGILS